MMLGSSPIFPLPAPAQVAEGSTDAIMDESEKDLNKISLSALLPASVATHTKPTGIIYPPPDIRAIVDTTARYVAKMGPIFEKMILNSNARNAKFSFLTASDPYYAYYQHRLSEERAQPSGEPSTAVTNGKPDQPSGDSSTAVSNGKHDQSAQFGVERRRPLEPPEAEHYTVRLPEGITGEELEVIKLTAQFVARNGRSFLTGLTSREMNNPQFRFLKPNNSLSMLFTSLVDAYSKVVMPPNDFKNKLKKSVTDLSTILERCIHRLEWEKSQEQAPQKAENEIEIDWHDFVVIDTIDFADEEDDYLPPPMTLEEVIHAVQPEEIVEAGGNEVEMEMDDEEVQLVEDGMMAATFDENGDSNKHIDDAKVVVEEPEPPMRIVKDWKRPEERLPAERDPTKYIRSPITGEVIPISEMSAHMRISLIDSRYKEQKERMFAKIRETTLAQDDEISRNIVGLARTRPDIFGTTEEEVSNAVNAETEKKNTVQYSAPTSGGILAPPPRPPVVVNMMPDGMRPPPPPMHMIPGQQTHMLIRPPRSIPVPPLTPLAGYHQSFTPHQIPQAVMPLSLPPRMSLRMLPPPPKSLGMLPPPPPPPPEEALLPLPEEEPEPKRQKLDDSMLIPKEQFMAQHPGPACINVAVPNHDEGNLKGQVVEITLPSLSETVASLKEKIAGEIQLPANKQKLCGKAGFLKDNLSLAYYNVSPSDTLSLSLRERGGRKR